MHDFFFSYSLGYIICLTMALFKLLHLQFFETKFDATLFRSREGGTFWGPRQIWNFKSIKIKLKVWWAFQSFHFWAISINFLRRVY